MNKPIVLALALVALLVPRAHAGDLVRHEFEARASSDGIRRVRIDVPSSQIHVRTRAGNAIVVEGHVDIAANRGGSRENAQKIADAMAMGIDLHGSRATIGPRYGREARSRRARHGADYEFTVTVPPGTHVEVRQRAGSVDADGSFGDVDVAMHAGEAKVVVPRASVASVDASTRIGEIEADVGDRVVNNEGVFPRAFVWENPDGEYKVRLRVTVGEITIRLTRVPSASSR